MGNINSNLLIHNFNNTQTHLEEESGEFVELKETLEKKPPVNDKLYNFSLKGKTVQNGEPTPESPVPIQNVPSSFDLTSTGRNIYEVDAKDYTIPWRWSNNEPVIEDGKITGTTGSGAARYLFRNVNVYLKSGYIGHKSTINASGGVMIRVFDSAGSNISESVSISGWTYGAYYQSLGISVGNGTNAYFNITDERAVYIRTGAVFTGATGLIDTLYDFVLSNEDIAYEPFVGTTQNIKIKDNRGLGADSLHELCSLPDGTSDEIDVESAKIVKRVKTKSFLYSAASYEEVTSTVCRANFHDTENAWGDNNTGFTGIWNVRCNIAPALSSWTSGVGSNNLGNQTRLLLAFPKSAITTAGYSLDSAGIREYLYATLGENEIIFQYEYATPQIYDLHPDELEKLNSIKSVQYHTNIFTSTSVPPTMSFLARKLGNKPKELQNFYLTNGEQLLLSNNEPLEIYL